MRNKWFTVCTNFNHILIYGNMVFKLLLFVYAVSVAFCQAVNICPQYKFDAVWYKKKNSSLEPFTVTYYLSDNTVEVNNATDHKIFCERGTTKHICKEDMVIGSMFKLCKKKFSLIGFNDFCTQKALGYLQENTYGMIKPSAIHTTGQILNDICRYDFKIIKMKMFRFTSDQAKIFYAEHKDKSFFPEIVQSMTSDMSLGMVLRKTNAILEWRAVIGPNDVDQAKKLFPGTLRAKYGFNRTENALHGSDSKEAVERESNFIFPPEFHEDYPSSTANFKNKTACVLRLDSIPKCSLGNIILNAQKKGFQLSSLLMFYTQCTVDKFYNIVNHKEKDSEPKDFSSPCVGIEVIAPKNYNKQSKEYIYTSDWTLPLRNSPRDVITMNCRDFS